MTVPTAVPTRCPRCSGTVLRDSDGTATCIACGWTRDVPPDQDWRLLSAALRDEEEE